MAGASDVLTKAYIADTAINEYLAVVVGASANSCKLPAAANAGQIIGVTQNRAVSAADHIDVRKSGVTKLFVKGNSPNIAAGDWIIIHGTSGMGKKGTLQATASFGAGNAGGTFTAVPVGLPGEQITVILLNPNAINQALTLTVAGDELTCSLATDGAGAVTTTPAALVTAIAADAQASELVTLVASGTGADAITVSTIAGLKVQLTGADDLSLGKVIGRAENAATADDVLIDVTLGGR